MTARSVTPASLSGRAILFDLDGVLVDSRPCIDAIWRRWAAERGRDAEAFIRVAHGRRTSETLREVAPELDIAVEVAVLDAMEETWTAGLVAAPGAARLLAGLPVDRWGIVTSGSRAVATLRLRTASLPMPRVFVTGEEVRRGKPDPEPYRVGAERLGLPASDVLVVEDAPPGVTAARAAGMRVLAVRTTHDSTALRAADHQVPDLLAVRATTAPGRITLSW